ncbi:MAG: hypothetical protein DRO99_04465, partial [Candidatus Aenigmatarchaeota archaeon]
MSERTKKIKRKAAVKHASMRRDKRKGPSKDQLRLMHEMKAVQRLVEELMAMGHKPEKVRVRLGRMNADPTTFKHMFKEFAQ